MFNSKLRLRVRTLETAKESLENERYKLKQEVEDLRIKKKIEDEDIKHMVKLKEERQQVEFQWDDYHESAMDDANADYNDADEDDDDDWDEDEETMEVIYVRD